MSSRKHGDVCKFLSHEGDRVDELIHGREYNGAKRFSKHQTVGKVVDVLRGAGEMEKLKNLSNLWMRFTLLFQEVLHSLDIVVGYFLDLLDFQRLVHAEPIDDPLQVSLSFFAKAGDFGDFGNVRKLKKPFDLTNTRTWVH